MTRPAEPRPKTCSTCGAPFACGPGTGDQPATCWCQDLPLLPAIDPAKDCLCPACLKAALAAQADQACYYGYNSYIWEHAASAARAARDGSEISRKSQFKYAPVITSRRGRKIEDALFRDLVISCRAQPRPQTPLDLPRVRL